MFVIGSKFSLLIIDLLLANTVGSGSLADAYVISMAISTGLLNFILINIRKITVNELANAESVSIYPKILWGKILATIIFFTPLISLLVFKRDLILPYVYKGNSLEIQAFLNRLVPIAGISSVFYIFSILSSSSLDKQKPHIYPASNILQAIFISLGIIIYLKTKHVLFFYYSILFAFIVQFLFISFFNKANFTTKALTKNDWSKSLNNLSLIAPMLIFQGINELSKIYEKSVLSNFSEGTVSFFYYSNKLNLSILGIIITIFTYYYISPLSNLKSENPSLYQSSISKILIKSSFLFFIISFILYLNSEFVFNTTFNLRNTMSINGNHVEILKTYNLSGFFYAIIQIISILLISNGSKLFSFIPTLFFGVIKIVLIYFYFELSADPLVIAYIHLVSLIVASLIGLSIFKRLTHSREI